MAGVLEWEAWQSWRRAALQGLMARREALYGLEGTKRGWRGEAAAAGKPGPGWPPGSGSVVLWTAPLQAERLVGFLYSGAELGVCRCVSGDAKPGALGKERRGGGKPNTPC